jgi:hypothetical protein
MRQRLGKKRRQPYQVLSIGAVAMQQYNQLARYASGERRTGRT